MENRDSGESGGESVSCGAVDKSKDGARQHHQPSSPMINITVTGNVFEGRAKQPATSADVQVSEEFNTREVNTGRTEPQTLDSRGLGPVGTLRQRRNPDHSSPSADVRGLGPGRPSVGLECPLQKESSAEPRTLGPRGVGPGTPSTLQERPSQKGNEVVSRSLSSKGLGLDRFRGALPRADQNRVGEQPRPLDPEGLAPRVPEAERRVGSVSDRLSGATSSARKPLDRFRRPWGMNQYEYLSSGGDDRRPFVYLTPHGLCLHSSTTCRPMQSSGFAIQRSLCHFCFESDELPCRRTTEGADRVVYLTRSGHYVHASSGCECLDMNEELMSRKLCKCCRWR